MKSNYKKLGELIVECDVRNRDNLNVELWGVSIDKKFIKSVANTIGTDLTKYKIVKENNFVCSLMQVSRDEKIPIDMWASNDTIIVSPAYKVFRVKDTNIILPAFMNLWFKRAEFDREASFYGVGGVRGSLEWEDFCELQLPVPEIEEQQKIVDAYSVVERRIALKRQINDNLESQAYTYYQDKIADKDKDSTLSELAIITMGTSPDGESFNYVGNGVVFYQGRTDFGFRFPTIRLYTTEPKRFAEKNDILMSVRAPVGDINIAKEYCAIGRGLASLRPKDGCYSFLYYTLKQLNQELQRFNDDGTVFGSITKDDLFALKIVSLTDEERQQFETKISPIDAVIKNNEIEIANLELACSLLLSRLAN